MLPVLGFVVPPPDLHSKVVHMRALLASGTRHAHGVVYKGKIHTRKINTESLMT